MAYAVRKAKTKRPCNAEANRKPNTGCQKYHVTSTVTSNNDEKLLPSQSGGTVRIPLGLPFGVKVNLCLTLTLSS